MLVGGKIGKIINTTKSWSFQRRIEKKYRNDYGTTRYHSYRRFAT